MRRMATTLALSAWIGFAAVSSLRLMAHSGWLDPLTAGTAAAPLLQDFAIAADLYLPAQATLVFAGLFVVLATGLGMTRGELVGMCGSKYDYGIHRIAIILSLALSRFHFQGSGRKVELDRFLTHRMRYS